jgi:hypothetical protein
MKFTFYIKDYEGNQHIFNCDSLTLGEAQIQMLNYANNNGFEIFDFDHEETEA